MVRQDFPGGDPQNRDQAARRRWEGVRDSGAGCQRILHQAGVYLVARVSTWWIAAFKATMGIEMVLG